MTDMPEPSLVATSLDLEAGRIRPESAVAIHACPSCGARLDDRYHFDCPECGALGSPESRCRGCGGPLRPELVRYVALGSGGGSAAKLLPGVSCVACGVSSVETHAAPALGALANAVVAPLEVLPEAGYFTPERLEVLADADVCGAGEPEHIEKRRGGMVLRIGGPSPLFEQALAVVTEHDPRDIFSPTLSIAPGPPYSRAQRQTIQLLLADVQLELGAPVTCWSASVGLSEEPLVDPVLTEQLMHWEEDPDGVALALYHSIVAGQAPGRFVGSVRLLERVLGEPEPERFGEALRSAVERLGRRPMPVLQRLWLAMHPGCTFDEGRVYTAMHAFHSRYLAPRSVSAGAPLPWEEPDFEGYGAWLRRLVSELLAH